MAGRSVQCILHLAWHVFYETTGNLQTKTGDADVLTLSPGEDRRQGIQFVAPPSIVKYRWSPGLYSLDLAAWLEPGQSGDRPDLVMPYQLRVDLFAAQQMTNWRAEFDAQRDPDNAISIPIQILPAVAR